MRSTAFLVPIALVAGCNVATKNPAEGDGNVTIDAKTGGEVNFNLPFVNGKVKLPEGAIHGSNFDIDGVKLMPGSTVTGFSVFAGDKGSTVHMAFNAPATPDEVRAYFVNQFKQKDMEAAVVGNTVTGKSKDGSPFTIEVAPAAKGSAGKIEIHARD